MSGKDSNKKQKRKKTSDETQDKLLSKVPRLTQDQEIETHLEKVSPWMNLKLILTIQGKSNNLSERIDFAFQYVSSSNTLETDDNVGRVSQVLSSSRTLDVMNNWVQKVLVSSEKEMRKKGKMSLLESPGSCLDIRCWKILRFSLEESKKLDLPLTCFRDLLRVIRVVVIDASLFGGETEDKRLQLYDVVLDCVSLVFSFHGGVADENLDLWISLMDEVVKLVLKFYTYQLGNSLHGKFVLRLTSYLLEPFAKYLKVHSRKNGFRDFIDKLLEPLVHLLYLLRSSSSHGSDELSVNLSKLVGEVLSQGLFHSTHIDGFLGSNNAVKYKSSSDATVKVGKLVNRSYHNHLFDKVEKIVSEKNGLALAGLGEMIHLFVRCVPNNKNPVSTTMTAEQRKFVLDFFVQIMEYVLSDVNKYLQPDMKLEYMLSNAAISLKSMSTLLTGLIYDKVYLRTEDTSDGGFQNFLKLIYDTIMSFSNSITHLQTSVVGSDEREHRDLLISVRKELIIIVHNLLDIEYEVIGDDLENVWGMVFSSLACSRSSVDEAHLFPDILSLGCKLIDLYSKFRQADSSIFALCKAVKHSAVTIGDSASSTQSNFYISYSNSVSKLLCSSEFRLPLRNAIKSIPEGQSPNFVRQLTSDLKESLEWINFEHHVSNSAEMASRPHNSDLIQFNLRAEVLGKVLTDVYAIILDSVPVSSGNSSLFGASLRTLIDSIYPNASKLILVLPESTKKSPGNVSTCWIMAFLFRLVISCRSLLQQVVSLMPPDGLKKNPGLVGDSFTARSWKDWSEMPGYVHEGFSVPLLSIINSVSHLYTQDSVVICPPLCYVLHSMAFQRLVDLNRLINTSEYMLQWNRNLSQTNSEENSDFSSYRKRAKKWKKCVSEMNEEAVSLTKFILGYISTVDKDQMIYSSFGSSNDDKIASSLRNYDTPEFSVGSLDHKLLPPTMWLIICENVDLWCCHASKKDLKKFLTLLVEAFLSCESANFVHIDTCNVNKASVLKKVVAHQTALRFLSNTISHEQRSIRRYMASRFCKVLKNSVLALFTASGIDLSTSPDWAEVMSAAENLSNVEVGLLSCSKPNMVPAKLGKDQTKVGFSTCQHLLAFLIRMPGVYLSSKSSSSYITCILNLERLLVDSMLGSYNGSYSHNPYDTLQLFVSCRRVLKFLTAASCVNMVNSCPSPESPVPLTWLLKSLSAVSRFQQSLPQDNAFEPKNALFSLMDHTSNVFQTVSRDQFERGIGSSKKFQRKRKNLDRITEESDLSEHGFQIEESFDGKESILKLVETLVEHMQNSQTLAGSHDLTKSTSVIACLHGLLTALVSSFGDKDAVDGSTSMKLSSYHVKLMIRIGPCVMTCNKFLTSLLKAFFLEDGGYDVSGDTSDEGEVEGIEKNVPSSQKGGVRKRYFKRNSNPAIPDVDAFLTNVQNVRQCLKKTMLVEVLKGENHEASLFLQQLFLACSAILRLDLQTDMKSISWSLFPIVVGITQFMLLEFSSSTEMPHTFGFYCLNAIVKFIEVLGSYFPQTDPVLSRVFLNLVDLHIMAIGKCISFQRKEAKLVSQETGSFSSIGTSQLGEFKRGLRMSFETYVKDSSEQRLSSIIEAVERALVGVKEGLPTNYEILVGGSCGGEVSSVVAAGVDCLDLVLEHVAGNKHSKTLKTHIKSSVPCLFNIILHLQDSSIFRTSLDSAKGYTNPDPGSVILMCIGTLSTIYGKPSFFQLESCHIAQSLRVPGALFQYFLQLQLSRFSNSNFTVDWKFSVELYAGCCRLLCSSLKHHNNESLQCKALLQDSVNVLLNCLEVVRIEPDDGRNIRSTWEVQEAVKCASSLRRVYEEVRQQKDTFGRSSYLFLSSYIWVYCGLGPAKRGIVREVDEALKPGIYALMDSCSAEDFQLLHTMFGEGPCRSTLAALEHDYKVNYKYQGKV